MLILVNCEGGCDRLVNWFGKSAVSCILLLYRFPIYVSLAACMRCDAGVMVAAGSYDGTYLGSVR